MNEKERKGHWEVYPIKVKGLKDESFHNPGFGLTIDIKKVGSTQGIGLFDGKKFVKSLDPGDVFKRKFDNDPVMKGTAESGVANIEISFYVPE